MSVVNKLPGKPEVVATNKTGDNPRSAFVEPSHNFLASATPAPRVPSLPGAEPGQQVPEAGHGAYGLPSAQPSVYAPYSYPNADKDYAYPANPYGAIDMGSMVQSNYPYYAYPDANYFPSVPVMSPEAYGPYMWQPPATGMPARPPESGPSNGGEQHDEGRPAKQEK